MPSGRSARMASRIYLLVIVFCLFLTIAVAPPPDEDLAVSFLENKHYLPADVKDAMEKRKKPRRRRRKGKKYWQKNLISKFIFLKSHFPIHLFSSLTVSDRYGSHMRIIFHNRGQTSLLILYLKRNCQQQSLISDQFTQIGVVE